MTTTPEKRGPGRPKKTTPDENVSDEKVSEEKVSEGNPSAMAGRVNPDAQAAK